MYDGRPAGGDQHGTVGITVTATSTVDVAVTFPAAFATAPRVLVTSNFPGAVFIVSAGSITTTGFVLSVRYFTNTPVTASVFVTWDAKV